MSNLVLSFYRIISPYRRFPRCISDYLDLPVRGYFSDERKNEASKILLHCGDSTTKCIGASLTVQVLADEDKSRGSRTQQCLSLYLALLNQLVLRKYDPASLPDFRDPYLVARTAREVIQKDLNNASRSSEAVGYISITKALIQEEDGLRLRPCQRRTIAAPLRPILGLGGIP